MELCCVCTCFSEMMFVFKCQRSGVRNSFKLHHNLVWMLRVHTPNRYVTYGWESCMMMDASWWTSDSTVLGKTSLTATLIPRNSCSFTTAKQPRPTNTSSIWTFFCTGFMSYDGSISWNWDETLALLWIILSCITDWCLCCSTLL